MPHFNHLHHDDFDSRNWERDYERSLEKEPTLGADRQRRVLVADGTTKQWWAQRQQIAKVRP